ncbi:hypothetical protein B566_EDAN005332 [Ephemera danica]|nr:hypothetical protein B566_EDAN005332 [Ephemera danica]
MSVLTSLFCFWATLPGPPGLTISGGWFQAFPVTSCNGYLDPMRDVTFQLYQGTDVTTQRQLLARDDASIRLSGFDPKLPTVFYIHGFLDYPDAEEVQIMKQAYMTRGGHNFIVVNWRRLAAGPWYPTAVANISPVGKHIATLLDSLATTSGPLKSIHLIGHSLGSHIAGVAANNTKVAKVSRITGLDPAAVWINLDRLEDRLDPGDAPFVDLIHTDGGNFGLDISIGHADFYPNGGKATQPGCGLFEMPASLNFLGRVFCSHRRSYWLYAASVVRELSFMAVRCESWDSYISGTCSDNADDNQIPMGYATPISARGKYYLKVNEVPPY